MEGTVHHPSFVLFAVMIINSTSGLEEGNEKNSPEESPPSDSFLILGMTVTIIVMVVGSLGNLLTLCTLGHQFYMPRKARYIKDLTPDTVLIINLALADLFYSAISLPFMFATYYRLSQHEDPWVEHPTACQVSAFLRYTNAIAEWTTLGLMASERCITIYNFRNCRVPSRLFTTYKTICYCCGIWIVAILFQLATLTGNFGSFGYNELFVKCDFVQVKEGSSASITPRIVFFALESAVPCVLILIGYLVILFQVYSSSSTLSFFGSRDCQRMVAVRRSRTTRVIVKLLSVYLVCVIPVCVFNLCEGSNPGRHKDIGIFLYCIYWPQYCVNNFIYVVSNGRYRCAYYQFLCLVTCRRVSFPATPSPHCQPPHRGQIYSIHSSSTLQQPLDSRFRTPSECEEARCRVDSFFFSSFLSARNSDDSLKEAVHPNLCVSVSPDSCFSSHSASLSSTSSLQTLVKTKQRPRHLSHSVKRDLKAAGHKLRRTFSF